MVYSFTDWGSNPRPRDYESPALTAELQARVSLKIQKPLWRGVHSFHAKYCQGLLWRLIHFVLRNILTFVKIETIKLEYFHFQ